MSDVRTYIINWRDYILGKGEWSEEALAQGRKEWVERLMKKWQAQWEENEARLWALRDTSTPHEVAAPASSCAEKSAAPQTCPHVVGRTTRYCSLTPFTLTDKERWALDRAIGWCDDQDVMTRATLRSLLERTK